MAQQQQQQQQQPLLLLLLLLLLLGLNHELCQIQLSNPDAKERTVVDLGRNTSQQLQRSGF